MELKKAVVVVPIYKPDLDADEKASFIHNAKILGAHDVVAIHPEGLDLSFYTKIAPSVQYKAFLPDDFNSIDAYNHLMMSPRIYEAFSDYEYLLICHFDAWVFKDELDAWCEKGYDYIGAPFMGAFIGPLSSRLPFISSLYLHKVGNGGFCLRKINTHIRVTKRLKWVISLCLRVMHEDMVFTFVVPLFFRSFSRPSMEEANRFSIGARRSEECVRKLGGELPFGTHAWFKHPEQFWLKYIHTDVEKC